MNFRTFEISGHEHQNIVAINVEGYCLAVGGRDACLALLDDDERGREVPVERRQFGSTAAA